MQVPHTINGFLTTGIVFFVVLPWLADKVVRQLVQQLYESQQAMDFNLSQLRKDLRK